MFLLVFVHVSFTTSALRRQRKCTSHRVRFLFLKPHFWKESFHWNAACNHIHISNSWASRGRKKIRREVICFTTSTRPEQQYLTVGHDPRCQSVCRGEHKTYLWFHISSVLRPTPPFVFVSPPPLLWGLRQSFNCYYINAKTINHHHI